MRCWRTPRRNRGRLQPRYMSVGAPVTLNLPVQQLKPRDTRQLDLPSILTNLGLGGLNCNINLSFPIPGPGAEFVVATGSVDQSRIYVFPVPAEAIGPSFGKGISHWTVANGADTMYSLWNPMNAPQDFVATLYYGDGSGQYVMPVHLAAQAPTSVGVGMLIAVARLAAHGPPFLLADSAALPRLMFVRAWLVA